jgi:hypothetical protein
VAVEGTTETKNPVLVQRALETKEMGQTQHMVQFQYAVKI